MRIFEWTKRKSKAEIILYSFVSLLFLCVALSYIFILVYTFVSGAKTHMEVVRMPFSLPEVWHFENYISVFKLLNVNGHGFLEMLFNSIYFSVIPGLLVQFTTCGLAYTCGRYTFPGSKLLTPIILFMMTFPLYVSSGATYVLNYKLGFIDSYSAVLANVNGINVNALFYLAYYENMSWTYTEAAKIDGANDFQTFFKVMFPMTKPLFVALFIMSWMGAWNGFEGHLVTHPNVPTLPVGIYQFNLEMIYRARLDILFAACFIVAIPALVLFACFNKTLTENVTFGGLKG